MGTVELTRRAKTDRRISVFEQSRNLDGHVRIHVSDHIVRSLTYHSILSIGLTRFMFHLRWSFDASASSGTVESLNRFNPSSNLVFADPSVEDSELGVTLVFHGDVPEEACANDERENESVDTVTV